MLHLRALDHVVSEVGPDDAVDHVDVWNKNLELSWPDPIWHCLCVVSQPPPLFEQLQPRD